MGLALLVVKWIPLEFSQWMIWDLPFHIARYLHSPHMCHTPFPCFFLN